jgi:P pilus assembly chaperone PapD
MKYLFGIFCALFIVRLPAQAQITADKTVVYWQQNSPPVKNVAVRNSANKSILVEVRVNEVLNPGEASINQQPSNDILVAPKRFSVPPRGERTVRMLRRGEHGAKERVFRISFVPEAREDEDQSDNKPTHVRTMLRVLTGVGILLFTEPTVSEPKLLVERQDNKIVLKNQGNVNIALLKVKRCAKVGEDCEEIVPKRLYPGTSFEINDTNGKVISIRKRIGDEVTEENL